MSDKMVWYAPQILQVLKVIGAIIGIYLLTFWIIKLIKNHVQTTKQDTRSQ